MGMNLERFANGPARGQGHLPVATHERRPAAGRSEPITFRAFGTLSMALGSHVPVQPNSIRKRERSERLELAPWLIESVEPASDDPDEHGETRLLSARKSICDNCRCNTLRPACGD